MGRCRALALGVPLLLALLATQLARKGSYSGPPFTTVPVWTIPKSPSAAAQSAADGPSSSEWELLQVHFVAACFVARRFTQ